MPDPQRLVDVYHSSAATLNLVRAFVTGGYADLRQVHTWNTDFVRESSVGQRYELVAAEIERALTFMQAIGADPDEFHRVDFHSSHEALLLEYEHAHDAHRLAHRDAVRRLRALPLDRRAHPAARRGARRAAPPHPQPDRRQARARPTTADDALALAEQAQPRQRARPADVHHPVRRRPDPRRPARRSSRRSPRPGSTWRGCATPCTATPSRRPRATRPAASATSSTRCRASSTCTARSAPGPVASTSSSPVTT